LGWSRHDREPLLFDFPGPTGVRRNAGIEKIITARALEELYRHAGFFITILL